MLYAMHIFESFEPSLGGGGGRSDMNMGGALAAVLMDGAPSYFYLLARTV